METLAGVPGSLISVIGLISPGFQSNILAQLRGRVAQGQSSSRSKQMVSAPSPHGLTTAYPSDSSSLPRHTSFRLSLCSIVILWLLAIHLGKI